MSNLDLNSNPGSTRAFSAETAPWSDFLDIAIGNRHDIRDFYYLFIHSWIDLRSAALPDHHACP